MLPVVSSAPSFNSQHIAVGHDTVLKSNVWPRGLGQAMRFELTCTSALLARPSAIYFPGRSPNFNENYRNPTLSIHDITLMLPEPNAEGALCHQHSFQAPQQPHHRLSTTHYYASQILR